MSLCSCCPTRRSSTLIEAAFAKLKSLLRKSGARSREALVGAMGAALDAITVGDARGFFDHCGGYRASDQSLMTDALKRLQLEPEGYVLSAVHRAANTDDPGRPRAIFEG